MLNPRHIVLSAGAGPAPARRFLELLIVELEAECQRLGVRVLRPTRATRQQPSVTLVSSGPLHLLEPWLGTHTLLAARSGQSRSRRKRWHVSVQLDSPPAPQEQPELDLRDVEIRATRAGGPGGQHVNKTESAVQAVHLPTGVRAIARERRCRHQNEARALQRLTTELRRLAEARIATAQQEAHARRRSIVRGNSVCVWRLDPRGGLRRLATCRT